MIPSRAATWVALGVHPHIAQCYYVREIEGLPRIFVEWVGGGTLKDWMRAGRVGPGAWAMILDLAIQACDGLAHAHAAGLVLHPYTFRAENQFLPTELHVGTDPTAYGKAIDEQVAFLRPGIDGLFTDQADIGVLSRQVFLDA